MEIRILHEKKIFLFISIGFSRGAKVSLWLWILKVKGPARNLQNLISVTGRAHCQHQVAFFKFGSSTTCQPSMDHLYAGKYVPSVLLLKILYPPLLTHPSG